jgi:hypothetical protein
MSVQKVNSLTAKKHDLRQSFSRILTFDFCLLTFDHPSLRRDDKKGKPILERAGLFPHIREKPKTYFLKVLR